MPTLISFIAVLAVTLAQARPDGVITLTDRDRADIQELVTHYARALSSCAAEEYADLFAPTTGSFASGIRGDIIGREKLIALVQSEPHCTTTPAGRPGGAGPTVVITSSTDGVTGVADLGNAGHYEDVYVKTPRGWRFQSRNVITRQEQQVANFTAKDFIALRKLSGSDQGQFEDVYRDTPVGKRLRSSGVVITATAEGATGKAYLRDGGYYDDVYARGAGGWRFKTRTYVGPGDTAGATQASTAK